jgi:Asp-tRNA(Asn)/Glu-tRNA(Gln) amidotransferase A subunit family amidase
MTDPALCLNDATALAALIRERAVSPVEVVDAFLARIEALNPAINAFCVVAAEEARTDARTAEAALVAGEAVGPLHGVPVAFKDLTDTAGVETAYGSWIHAGNIPDADALIVERTRRAGGIMLGKTMTSEFGHAATARDLVHGATVNPWNRERIPGGSSGGSAAAVLAAMAPVAEGSDGGGSVRIPASCCGIFGLKPQLGRIPMPDTTNFTTLACHGPLTWTVRDAALLMSVWAGPDDRDPLSLPDTGDDWLAAPDGDVRGARIAYSPEARGSPRSTTGTPSWPAARTTRRSARSSRRTTSSSARRSPCRLPGSTRSRTARRRSRARSPIARRAGRWRSRST